MDFFYLQLGTYFKTSLWFPGGFVPQDNAPNKSQGEPFFSKVGKFNWERGWERRTHRGPHHIAFSCKSTLGRNTTKTWGSGKCIHLIDCAHDLLENL